MTIPDGQELQESLQYQNFFHQYTSGVESNKMRSQKQEHGKRTQLLFTRLSLEL